MSAKITPARSTCTPNWDFVERARRTTWQAHTDFHAPNLQTDIKVTGRRSNDWQTQWLWLSKYYPELLSWHRKWNFNFLRRDS